ncbi:phosphopantothenoylcysteine decarboxylase domain-containing protein [Mobiluncus mulieris]|uniref:Phosphopantothenoylcysteine decarboxylase n=1 Tax=Mobiluncus mulieris TaxID=2052 RepID=A0ABD4TT93_9ACTO|nr:phosphopantothenoylcysteine decarboxylase [Mobiluncus mulieris]MCU9968136.1 phosphopantothenoylcysteine decarboxylase [Mobiluncus mulieris]MCU9972315.1 phosphopantothenoylcysteine decarboxylase [Mobiluncus mulieris]NMW74538.1 phosphopantothenoylcysteine decarboxylase [Mobiluncus mulieris]NMX00292.1 phosphopantothenoylcysteine decarboxylase [Mobiluncus mulieris]NMX19106.1 phosphopantothenoylcysteine decarboxylase [Mobiluncus mulieris]
MTFTKVLVSAGGTREPWDEVRFLGNRSTGRQGCEIARAAVQAGFEVTLVAANVEAALLPPDVTVKSVETAVEMLEVMQEMAPHADVIIMCAAVADFRPKPVAGKLSRHDSQIPTLELERTPDILQHLLAERRPGQVIIGFGALTGTEAEVRAKGAAKARHKQADLLAVNQVGAGKGFATPTNTLFFFDRDGQEIAVTSGTKFAVGQYLLQLADKISQN